MIQYNPILKRDGTLNGAITVAPLSSLVFDLPGKAIWAKGVRLKGTDHTYTFSHDNYITINNTPGSNESEDIEIGVNIQALRAAVTTTYDIVSTTAAGLAPKFVNSNRSNSESNTDYYYLGWTGSTLKWYKNAFRNIAIDSNEILSVDSKDPLIFHAGDGISIVFDQGTNALVIENTKPHVYHNTDRSVNQILVTDNGNYRVLLKNTANDTSEIGAAKYASTLLYNPSTKILKVNGNAVLTTGDVTQSSNPVVLSNWNTEYTIATIGGININIKTPVYPSYVTQTMNINGTNYNIYTSSASLPSFIAPTSYGTNGQILSTNGNNFTWINCPTSNVTTFAVLASTSTSITQITADTANPYYNLIEGSGIARSIQFKSSSTISVSGNSSGIITFSGVANAVGVAGYVAGPTKANNAYNIWMTNGNGEPAWRAVTVPATVPTIGTSNITLVTIGGVEVKAKIGSYLPSTHTYPLSIATDTGTSSISLIASSKYKLTAGGSSIVFTSTPDQNVKQTPKTDNTNRPLMMINGGTTAAEQINTSMFSIGIYANASTGIITSGGFSKSGYDNTSVLLAGGGSKLLSDFSMSHRHPYVTFVGVTDDSTNHANQLRYVLNGTSNYFTVPYASHAYDVTVTNSDNNSTYKLVWHSSNHLYSTGGIYCNPSTDCIYATHYFETSDIRLKCNIVNISESIRKFEFKNDHKPYYGFIAQELYSKYPELVDITGEYWTVNYDSTICLIISKLENKIKRLEDEINKLKNK